MLDRAPLHLLYLNVLVVATCGLIYELLAGTLASYLLGDSVTQFSLIIGVYLSALGVGAWVSSFIEKDLAKVFIEVELAIALIGGLSTPLLFLAFPRITWFTPLLFGSVFVTGTLVGLELPLLMRILKQHLDFSELVSRVLAFDYIGALAASLLFPIFLLPQLGLNRTALLFGLLNALVGLWGTYLLRPILAGRQVPGLRGRACLVVGLLLVGLVKADRMTSIAEENTLGGRIIHTRQSPYQRIVVTESKDNFQLYLNGHLQFNSADEYRYHEALVHPAMLVTEKPKDVLVLGGGDGLALREIQRHEFVASMTLVDLDPEMTQLGRDFDPLTQLNQSSMSDPRLDVINQDAFVWITQQIQSFDVVVIDFPDPSNYSIGKLYSQRFFHQLSKHIQPGGVVAIQCTSPLVAPESYWCIIHTMEAAGFQTLPYSAPVPTFGVWGFALASLDRRGDDLELAATSASKTSFPEGLRYLRRSTMGSLFDLPTDQTRIPVLPNRLNDQRLVRLYEREWSEGLRRR
ncbi:MAG: polyamine aminopropyltransferase [Planctomycetota bacterium]